MEENCETDPLDEEDVPGDDDKDGICNYLDSESEESTSFPIWIIFVFLAAGLIIAGYVRMGNISKQMEEVIANTQYDSTEQVWEDSEEPDDSEAEELENLEKLKKKHGKK
jgi:hypothetical protein